MKKTLMGLSLSSAIQIAYDALEINFWEFKNKLMDVGVVFYEPENDWNEEQILKIRLQDNSDLSEEQCATIISIIEGHAHHIEINFNK